MLRIAVCEQDAARTRDPDSSSQRSEREIHSESVGPRQRVKGWAQLRHSPNGGPLPLAAYHSDFMRFGSRSRFTGLGLAVTLPLCAVVFVAGAIGTRPMQVVGMVFLGILAIFSLAFGVLAQRTPLRRTAFGRFAERFVKPPRRV